jgi:predicted DNA-binding transcriptional regulator
MVVHGWLCNEACEKLVKKHHFYVTFLLLRAILKADARCFTFLVEEQQKIREKRKRNLQQSSQTAFFTLGSVRELLQYNQSASTRYVLPPTPPHHAPTCSSEKTGTLHTRRFEICHRMTPCPKTNTISDRKSDPKEEPPMIFGGLEGV